MKAERARSLYRLAGALGAGALFALASPPFDSVASLWIGLGALAFLLEAHEPPSGGSRWRRALHGGALGWAFGIGANLVAFRFVPGTIARFTPLPLAVGALALLLLAAAQALRFWAAAIARSALVRLGVPSPLAFAAAIYAGTFVPMVFPWNPAGGAVLRPELVQLADGIGERGVSALMALSAGFLAAGARAIRERAWRRAVVHGAIALGLPAATALHGRARMAAVEAERARAPKAIVALVQPSIGATMRWDPASATRILARLRELTQTAEQRGAALTIWHETAYPYQLGHAWKRGPGGAQAILGHGVRGPVLTGAITLDHVDGEPRKYNAAMMITRDNRVDAIYAKLHLLWFGEAVPLAQQIPWLKRTFARGVGLDAGSAQLTLNDGPFRAGALICFEDTLPEAGREAMAAPPAPPNLLVNLTNDAWFTDAGQDGAPSSGADADEASVESELHLRMAILRSVELRRDMVRAVNFGPTSFIDATGRVRARYASHAPGVLLAEPALLETQLTVFARFGDAPFAGALAVATGAIAWATKRRRRQPLPP